MKGFFEHVISVGHKREQQITLGNRLSRVARNMTESFHCEEKSRQCLLRWQIIALTTLNKLQNMEKNPKIAMKT